MSRRSGLAVVALLLPLAVARCASDEHAPAWVGIWCPDDDTIRDTEDLMQAPSDEKRRRMAALVARAKAELRAALSPVEFTRDAIIVGPRTIPYTIASSDGDGAVLEVADGSQVKRLTLTMQDADTIVTDMAMPGKRIVLRRMYSSRSR